MEIALWASGFARDDPDYLGLTSEAAGFLPTFFFSTQLSELIFQKMFGIIY